MKRCTMDLQGDDTEVRSLNQLSAISPDELLENRTALRLLLKTLPPQIEKEDYGDVVAGLIDLLEAEIIDQRARQSVKHRGGFWNNRGQIIQAFAQGRLFTMSLPETDISFGHHEFRAMIRGSGLLLMQGFYTLPCFCVLSSESLAKCDMIWVWKPLRRLGLGRAFIKNCNITQVSGDLVGSEEFWKRCEVQLVDTL
jgi:hypothetical protein